MAKFIDQKLEIFVFGLKSIRTKTTCPIDTAGMRAESRKDQKFKRFSKVSKSFSVGPRTSG